ncbi:Uncharacterised protein [Vibrio cholerae]|nr:Uncharacterised protein [Vibrio cholerae]
MYAVQPTLPNVLCAVATRVWLILHSLPPL